MSKDIQIQEEATETALAEINYEDYIEKVEEAQAEGKTEEVNHEESTHINPQLRPESEAIVKSIEWEEDNEQFKIVAETHSKDCIVDYVSADPYEDGSEWDRLCDYVGVPAKPTKLKEEVVPIERQSDSKFSMSHIPEMLHEEETSKITLGEQNGGCIRKPPVMKGLNPVVYRFSRFYDHHPEIDGWLLTAQRTFDVSISALLALLGGTCFYLSGQLPISIVGFLIFLLGTFGIGLAILHGIFSLLGIIFGLVDKLQSARRWGSEVLFPEE